MYSFQEERFTDVINEAKPLLHEHWIELANNKEVRPLNPDYEKYAVLNRMGVIRVFTVRDNGVLVGYASYMIAPHLHYKQWVTAVSDIYYLAKKYRTTRAAPQMFMAAEKWLRSLGVNNVIVQDKVHHSHEKFFTRMGYKVVERNYEKVLSWE